MYLRRKQFPNSKFYKLVYVTIDVSWRVSWKFPLRKFPPMKLPPGEFPRRMSTQSIPTWNIPTHVFKYSHPGFFNCLFFHHWYFLKDWFVILCLNSGEVRLVAVIKIICRLLAKMVTYWKKFCWSSMIIGHCYNPPACFECFFFHRVIN